MSTLTTLAGFVLPIDADTSRAESRLRGFAAFVDSIGQRIERGLTIGVGIQVADAAFNALARSIGAVTDSIIGFNGRLEQTQVAFTAILGSGGKATDFINQIQTFAAKTPFEFPDALEGARRLLAMGVAMKDVLPLMTAVGNAASAFSSGDLQKDFGLINLALTQMIAKGRVMSEEMRQITERGIPAWDILLGAVNDINKANGKATISMQQLFDQVHKGEIAGTLFVNAFAKWSDLHFGDMMEAQSQTFSGALSNIKDGLRNTLSEGFEPFFAFVRDNTVTLANFLTSDSAMTFASRMNGALQAVGDKLAWFNDAWHVFTASFMAFGLGGAIQSTLAYLDTVAKQMFGAGYEAIKQFAEGMLAAAQTILHQVVTMIADFIASMLIGHSPPPEGPLKTIDRGGYNTGEAWIQGFASAFDGFDQTIAEINSRMGALGGNGAADLDSVAARYQQIAGNVAEVKALNIEVEDRIRLIDQALTSVKDAMDQIKDSTAEVNAHFDDMARPLQETLDYVQRQRDFSLDQADIAMQLQQAELDRAELIAQGDFAVRARLESELEELSVAQELLGLENRRADIADQLQNRQDAVDRAGKSKAQLELSSLQRRQQLAQLDIRAHDIRKKGGPNAAAELKIIAMQRHEIDLRAKVEKDQDDEAKKRAQEQLAQAKDKADRQNAMLLLQQQEIDKKIELSKVGDRQALAQIHQQKKLLSYDQQMNAIDKKIFELRKKVTQLPLEEQLAHIEEARRAALKPLQDENRMLERTQRYLEDQKRRWANMKTVITDALSGGKGKDPAAGKGSFGAGPLDLPPKAYTGLTEEQKQAIRDAAKAFVTEWMNHIGTWFSENGGTLAAMYIGAKLGSVFGPLGAIAGAFFGPEFMRQLSEELAKRGVYLDVIGEKLKAGLVDAFTRAVVDLTPFWNAIQLGDLSGAWAALKDGAGKIAGRFGEFMQQALFTGFGNGWQEGDPESLRGISGGAILTKLNDALVRLIQGIDWATVGQTFHDSFAAMLGPNLLKAIQDEFAKIDWKNITTGVPPTKPTGTDGNGDPIFPTPQPPNTKTAAGGFMGGMFDVDWGAILLGYLKDVDWTALGATVGRFFGDALILGLRALKLVNDVVGAITTTLFELFVSGMTGGAVDLTKNDVILTAIGKFVRGFADGIVEEFKKVTELGGLMWDAFLGLLALAPVGKFIGTAVSKIPLLGPLLEGLVGVATKGGATLWEKAVNPIVDGFVAALGKAFGGAGGRIWEAIANVFAAKPSAVTEITGSGSGGFPFGPAGRVGGTKPQNGIQDKILQDQIDAAKGANSVVENMIRQIEDVVVSKLEALENVFIGGFGKVWDKLSEVGGPVITGIKTVAENIVGGLMDGIDKAGPGFLQFFGPWIFDHIPQAARDKLKSNSPSLEMADVGKDVVLGLQQGILDQALSFFTMIGTWVNDNVIKPVKSALGVESPSTVFDTIGQDTIQGLRNGMETGFGGLPGTITAWVKANIVDPARLFLFGGEGQEAQFLTIGKEIVQGLKDGISGASDGLQEWFTKTLIAPLPQWAKDLLGIQSPSTVFASIGEQIVEGLKNGIKNKFGDVQSLMSSLFGTLGMSGDVGQWLSEAIKITGVPADWMSGLMQLTMAESSGDPTQQNPTHVFTDSGVDLGQATGLLQTLPGTFDSYKLPGLDDIWNPVHNAVAAIRYIQKTYGSVYDTPFFNPGPDGYKGYARGGWITEPVSGIGEWSGQNYRFGEGGIPEQVVPMGQSGGIEAAGDTGQQLAELIRLLKSGALQAGHTVNIASSGTLTPEKAGPVARRMSRELKDLQDRTRRLRN